MNTLKTPQPGERLAAYIKRIRDTNNMTQSDVATRAGIHLHSLGKIERGITQSLNTKTRRGLSIALSIPEEYLESVCKGETVETTTHISFCPQCWQPGTPTDPIWNDPRAKFSSLFHLRYRLYVLVCTNCGYFITSFEHVFCPICESSHKKF
ncbi:helix-turn-helix domain-containing protein [Tolypothrix bouteillei VB521301_2]|uniref:helix-turn-helix domain-containing protein n=1 Tax=Tolypothrix bouteillei TaxID=1246981 RepID=UPI0038B66FDA